MNRSTGIYDKFASALSNAVQKMQVGDGFHEGVLQVISCAPYVTLVFPGRIDGTIFIFETLVLDLFYQVMMGSMSSGAQNLYCRIKFVWLWALLLGVNA